MYETPVFVGNVPILKFCNLFKKFKIHYQWALWGQGEGANNTYQKIQFGLTPPLKDNTQFTLQTQAYQVRRLVLDLDVSLNNYVALSNRPNLF